MGKLSVVRISEGQLKSFPEIACTPGYYLDVLSGDIFRNAGHFTSANLRITERHADHQALQRKPFLLVTEDLSCSLGEVKKLAAQRFGVGRHELGKLVHSME